MKTISFNGEDNQEEIVFGNENNNVYEALAYVKNVVTESFIFY